jgi:hypothetical protein
LLALHITALRYEIGFLTTKYRQMNIEEIAKRIAELHYPNKPNAIIDEPYRLVRMKTLRQQVETELKNCFIPDVMVSVCEWCGNKLCDSQKFNDICFKCGKSPYSKQTER